MVVSHPVWLSPRYSDRSPEPDAEDVQKFSSERAVEAA
jgi:hypothetical protein